MPSSSDLGAGDAPSGGAHGGGAPAGGSVNLPLMVLARICTSVIFMTYPASLNALLSAWRMSAAEGGPALPRSA
ncbi:hypothetical protein [Pelagibius marinus]|uniref:hypothetical protein n=1 Tax=Pelagibius marinus TaxID=2762760 RepID=UPI001872A217|nr:hypothetical protein [Pelagibius marinus]